MESIKETRKTINRTIRGLKLERAKHDLPVLKLLGGIALSEGVAVGVASQISGNDVLSSLGLGAVTTGISTGLFYYIWGVSYDPSEIRKQIVELRQYRSQLKYGLDNISKERINDLYATYGDNTLSDVFCKKLKPAKQ